MTNQLKVIAASPLFRNCITLVILLAGVLVGLETYPAVMDRYGDIIRFLDFAIIMIFVLELIIRIGAYGSHPFKFFTDPWNVFDFVIVLLCVLPLEAGFLAVFRLARILRILRLVTVLPKLQMLVGALLKSIPSLGYITLLLFLFFYVYACVGTFLFGRNDPIHFGTLHDSVISLFQMVTLEGWVDVMYTQMYGSDAWGYAFPGAQPLEPEGKPLAAILYFFSFIMLGTMIILNLFIGVIMNGMHEMQTEHEALELERRRQKDSLTLGEELHLLLNDVENIKSQLDLIRVRLTKND